MLIACTRAQPCQCHARVTDDSTTLLCLELDLRRALAHACAVQPTQHPPAHRTLWHLLPFLLGRSRAPGLGAL
eukprot:813813-Alexandrium_andersonii.AAC.1